MNKKFFLLIGFLITILYACVPSQGLEGGAGGIGYQQGFENSTEEGNSYQPDINNGQSNNNHNSDPGAEYQITAPRNLGVNENGTIKLIVIPNNLPAQKIFFQNFDKQLLQASHGDIDNHNYIGIKITSADPVFISPESAEIAINPNDVTVWQWNVVAAKAVNQNIQFFIFTPKDGDKIIASGSFTLNILEPTSTPSPPTITPIPPTTTPQPTNTPIPSMITQLAATAGNLTGEIFILILGTTMTLVGGYYIQKKLKVIDDKKQEEIRELEKEKLELEIKKFKENLHKKPGKRRKPS